ncbi:MAG: neutral/alkaline non-lysosomal ceramidase N-terminal domain-containing protein [Planctomycetes bacterium]|nr:neutral/alkaline non-lysosomal ceramidase N-terminal domain-containing protein [Planctomycetota bacterium]
MRYLSAATVGAVLVLSWLAFGREAGAGEYPRQQPGPLLAGFARVDITPPAGVPLGGYSSRFGSVSKGANGNLYARAMVLDNGKRRVAVVTSDLIGIFRSVREGAIERLPRELGLRGEDVLISATHNHSAQGGFARNKVAWVGVGTFRKEVHDKLCDDFAKAITLAVADLKPASIGVESFQAPGLSANRAFDDGNNDPEIGLVKITGEDGGLRGLLVNFAAHPTILDPAKNLAAPEWPGYLTQWLDAKHPGAVTMFTQGAHGDQRPAEWHGAAGDDFAKCRAYAEKVAALVEAQVEGVAVAREVHVALRHRDEVLPLAASGRLMDPRSIVQRLEIGDAWFVTAPGEMCVDVGLKIKKDARELGARKAFVISCANDHLGYFVNTKNYRTMTYEAAMTVNGPTVGLWIEKQGLGDVAEALDKSQVIAPVRSPSAIVRRASCSEALEAGVRLLVLRGTPYEMGYQHGFLLKDEIHEIYAKFLELAYDLSKDVKFKDPTVGTAAFMLGKKDAMPLFLIMGTRAVLPYLTDDQYEELQGLADGCGLSFNSVLALNVMLDICVQRDRGSLYKIPGLCTQFAEWHDSGAMLPTVTVTIGRNTDWKQAQFLRGRTLIIAGQPTGGRSFTAVTFCGFIGATFAYGPRATGVTPDDVGVAISVESVAADTPNTLEGTPAMLLVRHVAQRARNLSEAVRLVRDAKGTSDYHYLILDLVRGRGPEASARVVEVSMKKSIVRLPEKNFILGCGPYSEARWFEDGKPAPVDMPRFDDESKLRYAVLPERIDQLTRKFFDPGSNLNWWYKTLAEEPIARADTIQSVIYPVSGPLLVAGGQIGSDAPASRGKWAKFLGYNVSVPTLLGIEHQWSPAATKPNTTPAPGAPSSSKPDGAAKPKEEDGEF